MIITGFDLATRITGFCVGDGSTIPLTDVYEFPMVGDDIGRLLDIWDRYLVAHFERFKPEVVIYEAPILVIGRGGRGSRTDKPEVIRKIYSMGAYLEFFCRRRDVPCYEVTLQAVKVAAAGRANASKDAVVASARNCGLILPKVGFEDAADSWGAWLCGLQSYSPKASARWDKVIHSNGRFRL